MVRSAASRSVCLAICVLVGASTVVGCAGSDEAGRGVTYSMTAKQNYEKGLAELKDESYPEATKYFNFVKSKYPFSKYAVLSELALADTAFARGSYQEAIDSYKSFARLHPTHEKVEDGYVAFKIAEAYVKDMPEDFFILPPAAERDQSTVRDALRELNDFVDKFPDSPYLQQGLEYRRQVLAKLVEHELYVARFYLDRDKPQAAVMRIEGALRRFPDSGRDAELLLVLGQTLLRMGETTKARETFERVVREHAQAAESRRATLYLQFIDKRQNGRPAGNTQNGSARADG